MFHFCNHLRYSLPAEGPGLSRALAATASKCICVSSVVFQSLPWCIIVLHWESDFFKVPNGCVTENFFPLTTNNDQLLILGPWRNISVLQLIPPYWEQIVSGWIPLVFALAEINSRDLGCWQVHRNTWVQAALPRHFITSTSIRGIPWAAHICWAGRISALMWAAAYCSKEGVPKLQKVSHC